MGILKRLLQKLSLFPGIFGLGFICLLLATILSDLSIVTFHEPPSTTFPVTLSTTIFLVKSNVCTSSLGVLSPAPT